MFRPLSVRSQLALAVLATTLAVLVAILLRLVRDPDSPGQISSPLLLGAVVISAWYGGHGPGLLAAVLALFSLEYFFTPPVYAVEVNWSDLPRLFAFVGASVLVSEVTAKRRRAETELQHTDEKLRNARAIQQRFYPIGVPTLPGIEIAGASFPANTLCGDCFDYIPLSTGATGIVVADVSGHGLGPALLMAETRAYLRALTLTHDDLGQILTLTNRVLIEDTDGEFVTLFFAAIDPYQRRFTYAGAGHEGYLFEPSGEIRPLPSTSLPLGVEKDLVVPNAPTISMVSGQVYLVFTDGVCETRSAREGLFGIERSLEVVRANLDKSAEEIIAALGVELRRFSDGCPQQDDITIVALKIQEYPAGTRQSAHKNGHLPPPAAGDELSPTCGDC